MIEKEIFDFISNNQVATICCCADNFPYCFNCLYVVLEKEGRIAFKTSVNTKHSDMLACNSTVAGTILPDNFDATTIQGIQFEGVAMEEDEDSLTPAASAYYAKYPIAMAMPGKIWIVELHTIKFTDNSKGFGYKRSWKRHEETVTL